ncbi:M23 family metallopeptidase [Virgisporangium aurantiacum]|uniref:M23ase beta-sheet core domain-containing protein n=1 Tax=Virgisporangium aurantiacum TaxID=175570 RepID=A0A8J4E7R2_9ACTN|nr:M23 family metallopeptidase [Virgisporangium aurantiacum]GIJ64468.1 hypothetical protein Vau01_119840 [Virgisporangium aurantiacum]
MTGKAITTTIVLIVGLLLSCVAGAVLMFGGGPGSGCTGPVPDSSTARSSTSRPPVGRYTDEQLGHAATIVTVGTQMGVPLRGWVIAVATAIQESDLRNLPGGPDDSVGLFQQRPSQGWGTADQLHDPAYAAGRFFDKLLAVDGWQQMPLTEAAQAVQHSAYPDAYARHEADAHQLVQAVADAEPTALDCTPAATGEWTQPVTGAVVSGFRTPERPTHHGVDLAATRGTPIRAASTGTVTTVRCNVSPADHGCDVDGSPQIRGCGWYVDIEHPGGVVTRYCHMLTHPYVEPGQAVTVGEVIGIVGTSGNSSGPHLHYEVHNGDHAASSATNPVTFMASVNAPLAG